MDDPIRPDDDFGGMLPTVLAPRSSFLALGLLIALSMFIKVWVLSRTLTVATDGYGFIQIAQRMEAGPFWRAVRDSEQHPLYPALLLAVSWPLRRSEIWAEPRAWELSGQLVAVLSSVLLVVPMYALGRRIFNRSVAFWSAALFSVMPFPARIAADCLSDSTCLFFLAMSLCLVMRATERRHAGWLMAALAAAGFAYLTRPEGLLGGMVVLLFALAHQIRAGSRWPRRQLAGAVLALVATSLVIVLPYGLLKGGITSKNSVHALLGDAPASARSFGAAWLAVMDEFARSTSYLFSFFAGLGLLFTVHRTWRRPSSWLAGLVWFGTVALVSRLSWKAGYLSQRHVLPAVLITTYWSTAGLIAGSCYTAWGIRWLVRDRGPDLAHAVEKTGWRLAAGSLGLMVLFCLPALTRPLHRNRTAHLEAAAWLARHTARSDIVVDLSGIASFHAERPAYSLGNSYLAAERGQHPRFLVAEENDRRPSFWRDNSYLEALLAGSTVVARFPEEPMRDVNPVVIYRLAEPARLSRRDDGERR